MICVTLDKIALRSWQVPNDVCPCLVVNNHLLMLAARITPWTSSRHYTGDLYFQSPSSSSYNLCLEENQADFDSFRNLGTFRRSHWMAIRNAITQWRMPLPPMIPVSICVRNTGNESNLRCTRRNITLSKEDIFAGSDPRRLQNHAA